GSGADPGWRHIRGARAYSATSIHFAAGPGLWAGRRTFGAERAAGEGSAQARTSKATRCSAPKGAEPAPRVQSPAHSPGHASKERSNASKEPANPHQKTVAPRPGITVAHRVSLNLNYFRKTPIFFFCII